MVEVKYVTEAIANFISKYQKLGHKVSLPKWEFVFISISDPKVVLTDSLITVGDVPFSCTANVLRRDDKSNVLTTVECVFGGIAKVKEYENACMHEMLPDVEKVMLSSVNVKLPDVELQKP